MEVSNNLPSDLSWFNLKRYEPCQEWSAETWFRVLKDRKLCYETVRSHIAIYGEVHPGLKGFLAYSSIFREPQEFLDEQTRLKAWREFEMGKETPCVTPMSFFSAMNLSAMIDGYSEAFMEPSYSIMQSRCGRSLKPDSPWREELVRDGVKVTERTELEKCRMLLGYQGIDFPEDHSVIYDHDLKRLPVDAILRQKQVHLTVDLNADNATLIEQFEACINQMREKLQWNASKKGKKQRTPEMFKKWHNNRLLPFLDIFIVRKTENLKWIKNNQVIELLFSRHTQDMENKYKEINSAAEYIISDENLNSLKSHFRERY